MDPVRRNESMNVSHVPVNRDDVLKLPELFVGQRTPLVRETLRSHACFAEPYLGLRQSGCRARDPRRHIN